LCALSTPQIFLKVGLDWGLFGWLVMAVNADCHFKFPKIRTSDAEVEAEEVKVKIFFLFR
jgi:hypothetical protein